ncbi:MAG TPA: hypothetical protein VK436_14625 [Methanocella sp.]|nr:hypothetical protein [Methanocella sp.]
MKSLQYIPSMCELLNLEVIRWGKAYDLPIHENYWMTETGCNVIANFYNLSIKTKFDAHAFPGRSSLRVSYPKI